MVDEGRTLVAELIERGVPSVHFYVMQYTKAIKKLMSRLDV